MGAITVFENEIYNQDPQHFFGKKLESQSIRDHKDFIFNYRVNPKDNQIYEFEEIRSLKSNIDRKICG